MTKPTKQPDVVWEDLPPKARGIGAGKRAAWKDALRSQPGRWARVPLGYRSASGIQAISPGFEVVARTVDGEKVVYARFVGLDGEYA